MSQGTHAYRHTFGTQTWTFRDLREVMAKATPARSGDYLAEVAADIAVLLSERGLGGADVDLETRRRRWRSERGKKAEAARASQTMRRML